MPVGGAEDFAIGVARRFSMAIEPRFVCLRNLDVLGAEAKESGLRVDIVPVFPRKQINPFRILSFARRLRREGIDIVHSQTYHAHIFSAAAARLANIPFVLHQQKTLSPLSSRKEWIFGKCVRSAAAVVTLSEQTGKEMIAKYRLPSGRVVVVPNAIDDTVFVPAPDRDAAKAALGLPAGRFVAGTVASLHPVKNHRLTLLALARWPEREARPLVVFVGEGAARAELERQAAELGVAADVLFAGRRRPSAPWFQAMDAFVLPSVWEGQPLAMLQAVSCGLPVLASRIEGNVAVLGEEHPALFSPEDPVALRDLLARAMNDEAFRGHLLLSQKKAAVVSSTQAAGLLEVLYLRLAGNRRIR